MHTHARARARTCRARTYARTRTCMHAHAHTRVRACMWMYKSIKITTSNKLWDIYFIKNDKKYLVSRRTYLWPALFQVKALLKFYKRSIYILIYVNWIFLSLKINNLHIICLYCDEKNVMFVILYRNKYNIYNILYIKCNIMWI